jgi:aminopeptidase 2
MCGSRRGDVSGSTNLQGREVLPTNVKPLHYDLTLEPNFDKFTYDGTVVIEYDASHVLKESSSDIAATA